MNNNKSFIGHKILEKNPLIYICLPKEIQAKLSVLIERKFWNIKQAKKPSSPKLNSFNSQVR